MPCPFHSDRPDDDRSGSDRPADRPQDQDQDQDRPAGGPQDQDRPAGGPQDQDRGNAQRQSRRAFVKAAVAIGGVNALAACAQRDGEEPVTTAAPKYPQGPDDLSTLPDRQHAWGAYLPTSRQNQIVFPQHQVFVFLNYLPDGTPTDAQRDRAEDAFRTLERAFQRGMGTTGNPLGIDGLLFSVAYAPSYFDVFEADLPDSANMLRPETVLERVGEDPELAGDHDAVLHLGSDIAEIVLGAEEALFGEVDQINGVERRGGLDGVFERAERRSGVIGSGVPDEKLDRDVSEKAPIPMGFKSAFRDTLPSEDRATLQSGPFAGGTTQHVSKLREDLSEWYDQSHGDRVDKMFAPSFDESDVGEAGERLGNFSGVSEETADSVPEAVEDHGRVGHSQKVARARDDDFDPIIMRRGDFFQVAESGTVLNFGAIHRDVADFVRTRQAMAVDFGEDDVDPSAVAAEDDGILGYIETESRATFLMPPRDLRALPPARPE